MTSERKQILFQIIVNNDYTYIKLTPLLKMSELIYIICNKHSLIEGRLQIIIGNKQISTRDKDSSLSKLIEKYQSNLIEFKEITVHYNHSNMKFQITIRNYTSKFEIFEIIDNYLNIIDNSRCYISDVSDNKISFNFKNLAVAYSILFYLYYRKNKENNHDSTIKNLKIEHRILDFQLLDNSIYQAEKEGKELFEKSKESTLFNKEIQQEGKKLYRNNIFKNLAKKVVLQGDKFINKSNITAISKGLFSFIEDANNFQFTKKPIRFVGKSKNNSLIAEITKDKPHYELSNSKILLDEKNPINYAYKVNWDDLNKKSTEEENDLNYAQNRKVLLNRILDPIK